MNLLHQNAKPYNDIITDYEEEFNAFLEWEKTKITKKSNETYIIQFVKHPNFEQENKEITYFKKDGNSFKVCNDTNGYKKANSFKNFKTNKGEDHKKGLFYELNLYLDNKEISYHHTSTIHGSIFLRDASHDGEMVQTKGKHWKK